MEKPLLTVEIKYEHDVVLARQRARQIAELLGFESQDQVRIATAVSELARNAFRYAAGGKVAFSLSDEKSHAMRIAVSDKGSGIQQLEEVLGGTYVSTTGMGLGLVGVRRLMDVFDIHSDHQGTRVVIAKKLPRNARKITPKDIAHISSVLGTQLSQDPFHEMQRQNQELLATLDEIQKQRSALAELNQELEETNRGVVALYAELDERADYLKRASELKTQFLSNMTHEFRTPLNSILSIAKILLDRMDGELTPEQEKQVMFIQSGARSLSELVNDLLDLAKVEAGKVTVRTAPFVVTDMFGMLRGMLKPLIDSNLNVKLIFDKSASIPELLSDEGKVSQVLRNFISNGIKYTEKGEVRVSAKMLDDDHVKFDVKDTGVGIAPEDHQRIFEEFAQVEGAHQQKIKGTGLGLPLSRKLAELLGGYVEVKSTRDKGSTFSLILPIRYEGKSEVSYNSLSSPHSFGKVLVIDDNPAERYVVKKFLNHYAESILEASGGHEGLELAQSHEPNVIILDLVMGDMPGAAVLTELKKKTSTRSIPVIIHTSKTLGIKERTLLLTDAAAVLAKGVTTQDSLIAELEKILIAKPQSRKRKAFHG